MWRQAPMAISGSLSERVAAAEAEVEAAEEAADEAALALERTANQAKVKDMVVQYILCSNFVHLLFTGFYGRK